MRTLTTIVETGFLADDSEDVIIQTLRDAKLTDEDAQFEFNNALYYELPRVVYYLLTNYHVNPNSTILFFSSNDANRSDWWSASTPLHVAARADMGPVLIEELLRRGATPNFRNAFGYTPAYYAAVCTSQENVNSIVALLRYGADFNSANLTVQGQPSPLVYILRFKPAIFLKSILRSCKVLGVDVDLNVRNELGNTPLHYADKLDVAATLMQYGANEDILNNNGEPAWQTNKSIRVQDGIKSIRNMILVTHKMTNRIVRPRVYLPQDLLRMMTTTLYVGVDDDVDENTDDDDDEYTDGEE